MEERLTEIRDVLYEIRDLLTELLADSREVTTIEADRAEVLAHRAWKASDLPPKAVNALAREGLTPNDIASTPDRTLLRIRGIGEKTLASLRAVIPYEDGD
jgi:predicted DNA-binding helix-hairpin-helix protein